MDLKKTQGLYVSAEKLMNQSMCVGENVEGEICRALAMKKNLIGRKIRTNKLIENIFPCLWNLTLPQK